MHPIPHQRQSNLHLPDEIWNIILDYVVQLSVKDDSSVVLSERTPLTYGLFVEPKLSSCLLPRLADLPCRRLDMNSSAFTAMQPLVLRELLFQGWHVNIRLRLAKDTIINHNTWHCPEGPMTRRMKTNIRRQSTDRVMAMEYACDLLRHTLRTIKRGRSTPVGRVTVNFRHIVDDPYVVKDSLGPSWVRILAQQKQLLVAASPDKHWQPQSTLLTVLRWDHTIERASFW